MKLNKMTLKKNPLHYNLSVRYRFLALKKMLKLSKDKKVLDVGCGLGYMISRISSISKVYGVDTDKECVRYCVKNGPKGIYNLIKPNRKLPFKKNHFDYVISSEVIEHVYDDIGFLNEIKRVLKPGGVVLITTPSSEGLIKISEICHKEGSERHFKEFYSENELRGIFIKVGLKIISVRYVMILFTQIFMELTKIIYSKKNKSFQKQSDILQSQNSPIFKLYKIFFLVPLTLILIDEFLKFFLKGSIIIIAGRKE